MKRQRGSGEIYLVWPTMCKEEVWGETNDRMRIVDLIVRLKTLGVVLEWQHIAYPRIALFVIYCFLKPRFSHVGVLLFMVECMYRGTLIKGIPTDVNRPHSPTTHDPTRALGRAAKDLAHVRN